MRAAPGGLGGGGALAPRSLSERGACAPNGRPLTVAANGCAGIASALASPQRGYRLTHAAVAGRVVGRVSLPPWVREAGRHTEVKICRHESKPPLGALYVLGSDEQHPAGSSCR